VKVFLQQTVPIKMGFLPLHPESRKWGSVYMATQPSSLLNIKIIITTTRF